MSLDFIFKLLVIAWLHSHQHEHTTAMYRFMKKGFFNEHPPLGHKVNDLYVEVYYQEHNIILKFNAFTEHELLDIYLPKN